MVLSIPGGHEEVARDCSGYPQQLHGWAFLQILNFCQSPFCFKIIHPHTVHIFSEAGILVDGGAHGAILALVARLTDGAGTDSSPSDFSVALDDSSSSLVSVFLWVYDL